MLGNIIGSPSAKEVCEGKAEKSVITGEKMIPST